MSISSTNRLAGLVSGLDTETLVKQMTSGTKNSINTQQQLLQKLTWKQADYRTVTNKILDYKNTYFNLLKPSTNISSSSLFSTKSASCSLDSITCSASAGADNTTYSITNIFEKAAAATIKSDSTNGKVIDGIKIDVSSAEDGESYTFKFALDGASKDITFVGGSDAATTQDNIVNALETAFTDMTFSISDNGRLTTERTDGKYTNMVHSYSISAASDDTSDDLSALGLDDGMTNQITSSKKLSDLAFATDLDGDSFCFSINGESFSFTQDNTVGDVISAVNNSDAGAKLSFNTMTGEFSLESLTSGQSSSLFVEQKAGNLLTSMFGTDEDGNYIFDESTGSGTDLLVDKSIQGNEIYNTTDFSGYANKGFDVTVNGETKTIRLWQYNSQGVKNNLSSTTTVVSQLNSELKREFGSDAPTLSVSNDTDTGKMTFKFTGVNDGDEITIAASDDSTGKSAEFVSKLGFDDTNSTNAVSDDVKLSDLFEGITWGGTLKFGDDDENQLTLDENTTLTQLLDAATVGDTKYAEMVDGKLFIYGATGDDEAKGCLSGIFGEGYNYPGIPPVEIKKEVTGSNAVIEVNGMTISSYSNTFTLAGTNIDISNADTGAVDASVTTSNDTSNAFDAIVSFVNDYNTLITDLNNTITTSRPKYQGSYYEPLTDEQEEDMSDTEIEKWEASAKTGMLYQDSTINTFLINLRTAMSGGSGTTIDIYDIGITVSSNYTDNGKLELDEDALKKALSEKPDLVKELFTDSTDGIATKMSSVIDKAAATTGATKGTLITLAGLENTSTVNNNTISKQLETYLDKIEALQSTYESEQDRYWSQFTSLETMMNTYNSQSAWLTSMFSSNS